MKLTTSRLKKIIKEELGRMIATRPLGEMNDYDYDPYDPAEEGPFGAGGPTASGRYETCPNCRGEGATRHWSGDPQSEQMCSVCQGEGEVEVYE